jgi:hypothetical protein
MMSPAFQAAFARLVTDLAFREAVQRGELPHAVTDPTERQQLVAVSVQPGLAAMRVVNRSFRLNKVLAMMPLTGRLLGEQRLSAELERYWADTPSGSFYYFEEAGRFCEHLWDRIERDEIALPLLRDVLLYEEASIKLQHAAGEGRDLLLQVEFEHHPAFLEDLAAGRPAAQDLPPTPTAALGAARGTGPVQWYVLDPEHPLPLFSAQGVPAHAGPTSRETPSPLPAAERESP